MKYKIKVVILEIIKNNIWSNKDFISKYKFISIIFLFLSYKSNFSNFSNFFKSVLSSLQLTLNRVNKSIITSNKNKIKIIKKEIIKK